LVAEVSSTPFGPELKKDEAAEDVKRLSWVGEAAHVISEEPRKVVLSLQDRFVEEHERP
jgi:hypothetical protein